MNVVVLDFETFFSNEFTLSSMTTESYIRDPRFEAHGCAIKLSPTEPAVWFERDQLPYIFKQIDWANSYVWAHHCAFDALILSHVYNVSPRMLGDTLSCARLLIGNHLSVSLESVRKHYGMPSKSTPYNLFKGKRWHELSPLVQQQVAAGAIDEVESIYKLIRIFLREMPQEELEVIDLTIKMFTRPLLRANIPLLADIWEIEANAKAQRVRDLGIDPAELQSAAKFQALLEAEGVEVEYKDGTNGEIPCFAKSDPFMQDLLEDEDSRIRALAEARIGAKSTLLQTRAETLAGMAQRGALTVYLNYCAAHTLRFGGGDKSNFTNFKKRDPESNLPQLRDAIEAPDGYLLIKPDASQIEYRLLCYCAGQNDQLDRFRRGEDAYVLVAGGFYGYPINKKEHPTQRQLGKVVTLQAGYMSGGEKIRKTLRNAKPPVIVSEEEGRQARDTYRNTHPHVVRYWDAADLVIRRMDAGQEFDWGPFHIKDKKIYLPNGAAMLYSTLDWHIPTADDVARRTKQKKWNATEPYWRRKTRKGWQELYSGKLVENCIQALARLVITQAMIRIGRMGYPLVSMEHDSIWILVPRDGREKDHIETCAAEIRRTPPWLPGIPLDCEVGL